MRQRLCKLGSLILVSLLFFSRQSQGQTLGPSMPRPTTVSLRALTGEPTGPRLIRALSAWPLKFSR